MADDALEKAMEVEQSIVEHSRLLIASIYKTRAFPPVDERDKELIKHRDELRAAIYHLVKTKRLFQIHDESLLTEMWDEVRKKSSLTDFMLSASIELRFRVRDGDTGMQQLIERLAAAYSSMGAEGSKIDTSTLDRIPTKEVWMKWLNSNTWLVVILLLDTVL